MEDSKLLHLEEKRRNFKNHLFNLFGLYRRKFSGQRTLLKDIEADETIVKKMEEAIENLFITIHDPKASAEDKDYFRYGLFGLLNKAVEKLEDLIREYSERTKDYQ